MRNPGERERERERESERKRKGNEWDGKKEAALLEFHIRSEGGEGRG